MPVKSLYPDVHIPENLTLSDFMLDSARQCGDRVGFVNGLTNEKTTFNQFVHDVECVAASMHKEGLRKGDVLLIFSFNCLEYLVCYMAAVRLGGTVAVINPLSTQEELEFYMSDSSPTWLVAHADVAETAVRAAKKYGRIKETYVFGSYKGQRSAEELYRGNPKDVPRVVINPREDVSGLFYSSGTTGRPKGVMLTHYIQITNLIQWKTADLKVMDDEPPPSFANVLPFYHATGFVMSLYCICNGHMAIIFPRFNLEQYLKTLQDYKVPVVFAVPPILVLLAKDPLVDQYDLSCVQSVVVGAAPLGKATEDQITKRLKLRAVRQAYGLTEGGPLTHIVPISRQKSGSIGRLIPNDEAMIVDPDTDRELGVNEDGEIWIKAPGLMKGYLNRPEETAATITSEGWLKTGDIGHYDEDGFFFIVDRLKELIKYKGFQVAPADLENLLLNHADVADAAVIGVPDEAAGELPRAYVVRKPDKHVTESDLQNFIAGHVAPHKRLRGGVVFLDAIPKSAAGKILRRVLRQRSDSKQTEKSKL